MNFFPFSGCWKRNLLRINSIEILVLWLFLDFFTMSFPEIRINIASLLGLQNIRANTALWVHLVQTPWQIGQLRLQEWKDLGQGPISKLVAAFPYVQSLSLLDFLCSVSLLHQLLPLGDFCPCRHLSTRQGQIHLSVDLLPWRLQGGQP